ncbi:MAG TPA: hypothetical protein VHL09_07675 [Dehalococcoidia bacterium]|nr:hypothetical protein [Dehalococcoidia bacterium]
MASGGKAKTVAEVLRHEFAEPLHQRLAALRWKKTISPVEYAALCALVDAAIGLIERAAREGALGVLDGRDKRVVARVQRALELLILASLHRLKVLTKKDHDLRAALGPFHTLAEAVAKLCEASRWPVPRHEIQERIHFLDRKLEQSGRDLDAVNDWIGRRLALVLTEDETHAAALAAAYDQAQAEMLLGLRCDLGLRPAD